MDLLPVEFKDLSVLRRLIFAVTYLPKDLPQYWSVVKKFVSLGKDDDLKIEPEKCRVVAENLQLLNEGAFATDKQLTSEMHQLYAPPNKSQPLGIILISSKSICSLCGKNLLIRHDRPSTLTVYTETFGTVVGTSYHKYCQNFRVCSFKQHYGYSTKSVEGTTITSYDDDWKEHIYLVSSTETAFEQIMLERFDIELLLAQISYSQKADIYNNINGYPVPLKQCTTIKKEDLPVRPGLVQYTSITCFNIFNLCIYTSSDNNDDDDDGCKVLCQRIRLDRRRFESAHLKYAMLKLQKQYPTLSALQIPVTADIKDTMLNFTPKFYQAFCAHYSGRYAT